MLLHIHFLPDQFAIGKHVTEELISDCWVMLWIPLVTEELVRLTTHLSYQFYSIVQTPLCRKYREIHLQSLSVVCTELQETDMICRVTAPDASTGFTFVQGEGTDSKEHKQHITRTLQRIGQRRNHHRRTSQPWCRLRNTSGRWPERHPVSDTYMLANC